jgi:hypothetical protein
MSAISEHMISLIAKSMGDLAEATSGTLIPIDGMNGHFISLSGDLSEGVLIKLFPIQFGDKTLYVYLQQS